jgi:hypothetical protein
MLVEPQTGAASPEKPRTRGTFVLLLGIVLLSVFGLHLTLSALECDQAELPAVELTK